MTPTAILAYIEKKFIKLLVVAVKKEIKLIKDRRYIFLYLALIAMGSSSVAVHCND